MLERSWTQQEWVTGCGHIRPHAVAGPVPCLQEVSVKHWCFTCVRRGALPLNALRKHTAAAGDQGCRWDTWHECECACMVCSEQQVVILRKSEYVLRSGSQRDTARERGWTLMIGLGAQEDAHRSCSAVHITACSAGSWRLSTRAEITKAPTAGVQGDRAAGGQVRAGVGGGRCGGGAAAPREALLHLRWGRTWFVIEGNTHGND